MQLLNVSMDISASAEGAQNALQDWGRLLLMISMALFVSYMLFMVGAVLLSAASDRVRGLRHRIRRERPVVQSSTSRAAHAGNARPIGAMQDAA